MRLKIKTEASIGEVLTSLSILISLVGVSINWHQDRQIEIKKQSTQMKELGIQAFSNVISWKELNMHFYDRAEVLIEDVSRSFADDRDNVLARDTFWKGITEIKNEIDYEILQKDLKTFHFTLLNNNLDYDSTFLNTITSISKLVELNYKDYLKEMQDVILSEKIGNSFQTAILGNKLRSVNEKHRIWTRDLYQLESATLQKYLHSIIVKTDKEILFSGNR